MKVLNRNILAALLAAAMILLAGVGLTRAYFSDYEETYGTAKVFLRGETQIEETVKDTEKSIIIKNTGEAGNSGTVVVRVQIFAPEGTTYEVGENWSGPAEDGWYYYTRVLAPQEETTPIVASVRDVPVSVDLSEFDVTVVHESALAVYDGTSVTAPEGWDGFPAGVK